MLILPRIQLSHLNVNIWAGPGVGKSTTAAGLFYFLKLRGIGVELITEVAKDLVYQGDLADTPQSQIITRQFIRQTRVEGHVNVAVCDSPVPLALAYCTPAERAEYAPVIRKAVAGWDTLDVLLVRDLTKSYDARGRYQTQSEAARFTEEVFNPFVREWVGDSLVVLDADVATVSRLTHMVLERLQGTAQVSSSDMATEAV